MSFRDIIKYIGFGIGVCFIIYFFAFLTIRVSSINNNSPWAVNIFAIFLIVLVLFISGVLGSKKYKEWIRKWYLFVHKDSSLLFPIDPNKPLSEALMEGKDNFLPTKQRVINFFKLQLVTTIFYIIITLIIAVLIIIFIL